MKALTNILTRLLMLMLLMLVACTEETAEVDNLTRGEQYVQVRMHVPGMTAAATRAADGEITSVTALSFNSSDQLLDVKTVNPINNVNANNGYNGNFNLTVPNGTQTIHFLANLPLNYSNEQTYVDFLKAKKGQSQVDVMTSLTTGDYQNLCYWGMATTYDGNTDPLSVTLYRNMAKITLSPSIIDPEFNDAFDETNLYIAGLDNPNLSGKLVPYNNGFYSHYQGVAPNYTTIPDGVQIFDHTYEVTEEGVYGYGRSLYVFEHENSNYIDKGLFVICRIGDAFYKVALTSDGVNPYQIIRNHEYIIYVSDVDDYQTDEYRSTDYYDTFNKTPINLEVKEVEQVAFNANATNINVNGNLTVTVDVPQDGTVTALTISAPGFTIKQGETILGNDGSYTGSDLTITGNNTTYTFVPNTFGQGKEITFTASGTNLQETEQTISVNVTAAIYAGIENNSTLYYDQDNQTVTVNVTMPKGLSAISIGGAENFMVTPPAQGTFNNNVYTRTEATTTQEVQFVFTLDKSKYTSQQGDTSATFTFSDARMVDESDKATSASVNNISLIPTPEVTFSQSAETIYLNGNPNYLNVTMTIPNGGTLNTLKIDAEGFTINNTYPDSYTDETTRTGYTTVQYTFTPTTTEATTITFTPTGTNIKLTPTIISVTVKESSMSVTPEEATINMDANPAVTSTTLTLTKPANMQNVKVSITDVNGVSANSLFNIRIDNNYDLGQNNDIFNDINSSNTSVQVALSVKDNTIPSGSYTVRFADSNNQSTYVDATITVQNTPKLIYEYTNKTLYLLDSTGESNPTSLDVMVTIPNGSTLNSLTIEAPGFIVKNEEQPLVSGGTYTDNTERAANSSVTYTFTPIADAADYTITFSSTDDDLIAYKEIEVTVKNEKAPAQGETQLWEGEELRNSGQRIDLTDLIPNIANYYKEGNEIVVYIKKNPASDENNQGQDKSTIKFITTWEGTLKAEYECTSMEGETYSLEIDSTIETQIKQAGIRLLCNHVTITKISVIGTPISSN